jgi:MFS family permease
LLFAVGCALVGISSDLGILLVATTVLACSEVLLPIAFAYTAERAPPQFQGRYQGAYTSAWSLGWLVGAFLGGAVFAASPIALWILCITLCVLSALVLGYSRRVRTLALEPESGGV